MHLLIDTHVLISAVAAPERLPVPVASLLADRSNVILFSPVSIREVAIKSASGRPDFTVRPEQLVVQAGRAGFVECRPASQAAARVASLPHHHRDPFDRLLVAQAIDAGASLLTADRALAAYGHPVLTFAALAARDTP